MTIVTLITDVGPDHRHGNNNTESLKYSQLSGTIAIFRLADEASGVVIDSSELVVLIGDMFSAQPVPGQDQYRL